MLSFFTMFCLLAVTSTSRGQGLNEFERSFVLSNSDATNVYAGSMVGCAMECLISKCVSFYWELEPEEGSAHCNIIPDIGYTEPIPSGIIVFRPKVFSSGRIVSLPQGTHSWNSAKALCESLGLILLPAPKTIEELFIFNNYEGFIDAIKNPDGTLTDSAGNALDDTIVLKYFDPTPADGCVGLLKANTRCMDCDASQPFPMQPLCLAP